ncbi:MAG: ABC transporter ATP-binding protein, partial [Anaerolineaceae bacterium]
MITFQNVSFSYPNSIKPAINNISFTIHRGELVLITGVSGSGKSTLLKCINGLVPHFSGGSISGKITIDGHDPVKESPKSLCQVVGFVFQDPECQFVMDRIEDEIAFVLENFDFPPLEIEERINKALSSFDLNDLRYRNISNLSGGEQQKVAIASVLALQPSILVLDEPTSQLDPESADNLLQILKDLNEHENLTIILSEHRLERVVPYTDRIIHLDAHGNLEAAGHPRQVLQKLDIEIPLIEAAKILEWKSIPLSVDEANYIAQHEETVSDIHIKNKKRNSNVILFPQVVFHMLDPVLH